MPEKIKKLELEWVRSNDFRRHTFLDYKIEGKSLFNFFRRNYDIVSPFGFWYGWAEDELRKQLLKESKSELVKSAVPIFVCPECGDLGCGAICVIVDKDENCFRWKEFLWVDGYSEDYEEIEKFGPFSFDKEQYQQTILSPPKYPF